MYQSAVTLPNDNIVKDSHMSSLWVTLLSPLFDNDWLGTDRNTAYSNFLIMTGWVLTGAQLTQTLTQTRLLAKSHTYVLQRVSPQDAMIVNDCRYALQLIFSLVRRQMMIQSVMLRQTSL